MPKGASAAVDAAAREFVARHGRGALNKVAKVHFRTTQKIQQETSS
jgi:ribonuclease HIII